MLAGTEFVPSDSKAVVIIARTLYGLKSNGAAWRAKLAETLNSMRVFIYIVITRCMV